MTLPYTCLFYLRVFTSDKLPPIPTRRPFTARVRTDIIAVAVSFTSNLVLITIAKTFLTRSVWSRRVLNHGLSHDETNDSCAWTANARADFLALLSFKTHDTNEWSCMI